MSIEKGNVHTLPVYNEKTGYFYIQGKSKVSIIDEHGEPIINWANSIEYDPSGNFFRVEWNSNQALFFPNSRTWSGLYNIISTGWDQYLSPVKKDGLWGFLDIRNGKLTIPCRYYKVIPFNKNGTARVKIKKTFLGIGSWASIDTNGKEVK